MPYLLIEPYVKVSRNDPIKLEKVLHTRNRIANRYRKSVWNKRVYADFINL